MMYAWVMSQFYQADDGSVLPVAYSYGYNHASMGFQANGWGLVWISLDAQQIDFLRSGTDPAVQVVGTEWDTPIQLLLDTYADKLTGSGPFVMLGQVLGKLGQWEPNFLMQRDPNKP
jgi:hypothetical protein